MKLRQLSEKYAPLRALITRYNNTDDKDKIEKIYYLQKLSRELYKYDSGRNPDLSDLFFWINESDKESWEANLKSIAYILMPLSICKIINLPQQLLTRWQWRQKLNRSKR